MKTTDHKLEALVRAAQVAGAADGPSEEFWREVAAHTALREHQRKQLVVPRNLLEPPKPSTI
jgi:hypothetical protein